DQCDRCRSIGAPKDPTMVKAQTAAKAKGTSELKAPPTGVPGGPKPKVKAADHVYRPPGSKGAAAKKKAEPGLPIPLIAGGALVGVLLVAFLIFGHGKPSLSDEEV